MRHSRNDAARPCGAAYPGGKPAFLPDLIVGPEDRLAGKIAGPTLAIIAILIASGFLVGCSRQTAQPIRIAIGGQAQLIYLAATLAQELGYYKDEGLSVTLLDFPGGQKSLEALLGGSTDVVCGFYDHTIVMAAEHRELRAFVAMLRYPGLVAASPAIARIEDLKGKIVGVSAAGSSTNFFLNHLLVSHGMKPEDVSTASIGMSATAVAAVSHSKVDAAIMTDPALAMVRKQLPDLHVLADTRTADGTRAVFGVESYPSAVLYSTAQWIDGHRPEAKKLAHAITRTLDWMRSHSPEEIRARMPGQFRTDDQAADIEGLQSLKPMLSEDGRLSLESAAAVRKVLNVSLEKVRSANIDLTKTYTNEFLGQ